MSCQVACALAILSQCPKNNQSHANQPKLRHFKNKELFLCMHRHVSLVIRQPRSRLNNIALLWASE